MLRQIHVEPISVNSDDGSLKVANTSKLDQTSRKIAYTISACVGCRTERIITDQQYQSLDIPPRLLELPDDQDQLEAEAPTPLYVVHQERSFNDVKNLVLSSALLNVGSAINRGENQIIVDMDDNCKDNDVTCLNKNEILASSVATTSD